MAGEIIHAKKPDPEVELRAARKLGIEPSRCMVVEDSHNGLQAALGAGMTCVITKSTYTAAEDFTGAAAIYPELGDPPASTVTLKDLNSLLKN